MTARSAIPNFFIIGAPKCGTTAMSEYLRAHSQVFMSFPKEPSYLADDLPEFHAVHSMADYLKLFQVNSSRHTAIGEASVWYLYSKTALENILKLNPAAKVIVMLRHPVDFLESYHAHMLFSLIENEDNFEKAWALQDARAKGMNIPPTCRTPMLLQYDQIARFGDHMENVFNVVPREQVKCVLFNDFHSNPRATYLDVLTFLGLRDDGRTDFPRVNARKTQRSARIASLMFSPPPLLRSIWRGAKAVVGPGIIHLANRVLQWNSATTGLVPMPTTFKRHLTKILKEDMVKLEELIGRDLGDWYSEARIGQRDWYSEARIGQRTGNRLA